MKATWEADTVRVTLKIRKDIKAAMEELALRRHRVEGAYVSLGRVFGEAGILLLQHEGVALDNKPPERLPAPKPPKPARSAGRRKVAVRA